MLRLLFALALLTGAATATPAASALSPGTTFALDAASAVADGALFGQAQGYACFTQNGTRHCGPLVGGLTCAGVANNISNYNANNPRRDRMHHLDCTDASVVAAFNGQVEADEMLFTRESMDGMGDGEPPRGGHVGVFVTYFKDREMHMVEAGEGSDIGALLAMADAATGCGGGSRTVSVHVLTTEAPGTVAINGRRIEVEQARISAKPGRSDLYGEILINGDPLDFEFDSDADGIPDDEDDD